MARRRKTWRGCQACQHRSVSGERYDSLAGGSAAKEGSSSRLARRERVRQRDVRERFVTLERDLLGQLRFQNRGRCTAQGLQLHRTAPTARAVSTRRSATRHLRPSRKATVPREAIPSPNYRRPTPFSHPLEGDNRPHFRHLQTTETNCPRKRGRSRTWTHPVLVQVRPWAGWSTAGPDRGPDVPIPSFLRPDFPANVNASGSKSSFTRRRERRR